MINTGEKKIHQILLLYDRYILKENILESME